MKTAVGATVLQSLVASAMISMSVRMTRSANRTYPQTRLNRGCPAWVTRIL